VNLATDGLRGNVVLNEGMAASEKQERSFGCYPGPGQSAHARVLRALCNESREKLGEFEA